MDLNEKFGGVVAKKRGMDMREALEKVSGVVSKRSWWAILWLCVGQAIQFVANVLSGGMSENSSLMFCGSAGFLVLAAIVVGMLVGRK